MFNMFFRNGPLGGNGNNNNNGDNVIDIGEEVASAKIFSGGIKRWFIFAAAIILIVIFYGQCVVVTKPDEFKAIQQFGEIKRVTYEAGVSLKLPFIQTTRTLTKRTLIYDVPISDVITRDKKTMVADSFVLWRVSDPTKFIRTLSGNIKSAELRIGNIAYNSMKNVISQLNQADIISGRDTLAVKIFENIGDTLEQYGVDLIAIETKHLDLPDDNKQAVYTRMISERNNMAASYQAEGEEEARKIRTETDKTVSIMLSQANAKAAQVIADGEKGYMEILAEAYNSEEKAEFYSFTRALDAAKESLKNGSTTLILTPDSPIAQIFYRVE